MKILLIFPIILVILGYLYLEEIIDQQSIYIILSSLIIIYLYNYFYCYDDNYQNNSTVDVNNNNIEINIKIPLLTDNANKIIYWIINKNDKNSYNNFNKNGMGIIKNGTVTIKDNDLHNVNYVKYRILYNDGLLSDVLTYEIT
jgi:hypothetical protein